MTLSIPGKRCADMSKNLSQKKYSPACLGVAGGQAAGGKVDGLKSSEKMCYKARTIKSLFKIDF